MHPARRPLDIKKQAQYAYSMQATTATTQRVKIAPKVVISCLEPADPMSSPVEKPDDGLDLEELELEASAS
jgi:hypothetical protein